MNIFNRGKRLGINENEFEGRKQANLELDKTSGKGIQVSVLTISMVIFDVDTCLVILHVLYILICELFMDRYAYDMICVYYKM